MDSVCRTCLTLGDLSPIFSNRKQHTLYTSVLLMTTGLKIELGDGLPQCMCEPCTRLVNSALRLRDQSHHAQQILLENGFRKERRPSVDRRTGDPAAKDRQSETFNDNLFIDDCKFNDKSQKKDVMKKEFKIEIDLSTAASLLDENNSKSAEIISESNPESTITDSAKVKRKHLRKKVKEKSKQNCYKEEFSDDNVNGSDNEDMTVETEELQEPTSTVKDKKKYVRKKTEENLGGDSADTQPKVKRKYVRKSEKERLEAKAKKGQRLTRKQTVEKYRHMMESDYRPKQPVVCRVCKKQFARMSTFIPHVKRHFVGEYVCEQCGRRFHTRHSLSEHGMRLHGAERVLCCQHCDYRAIDQYQLKNHIHKVHTGERPFVCDLCGADFYCKSNIRQHMRKHYATKNVQCDRCPAMFNSRSSLASHTAKSHRMNFAYLCYLCPSRYTGRCAVRSHLTRQHGIARQLQGPVAMRKWSKNEPPPPDVACRITS